MLPDRIDDSEPVVGCVVERRPRLGSVARGRDFVDEAHLDAGAERPRGGDGCVRPDGCGADCADARERAPGVRGAAEPLRRAGCPRVLAPARRRARREPHRGQHCAGCVRQVRGAGQRMPPVRRNAGEGRALLNRDGVGPRAERQPLQRCGIVPGDAL